MNRPYLYELEFHHPGLSEAKATDVVEVHRTERSGPGGHPIYMDDTGIVRAEISDRGEVRMLASGGHQDHAARVTAHPLGPREPRGR